MSKTIPYQLACLTPAEADLAHKLWLRLLAYQYDAKWRRADNGNTIVTIYCSGNDDYAAIVNQLRFEGCDI